MNIVQVNTHDVQGGAARVAYGLHLAFRSAGHDSKMIVGVKRGSDPDVLTIHPDSGFFAKKALNLKWICSEWIEQASGLQYFLFSSSRSIMRKGPARRADIVHFHNTHGSYLNQWAIRGVSHEKPVVWTLHDMWALTGHCAHSFDCERWKTGCGMCPALDTYPSIRSDRTRMLWKIKSKVFRESGIILTVPSKWLMDKLPDSILSHFPAYLVPNAVDTDIFKPKDRQALRKALGLPQDRFIAIFVADTGSRNKWKGFEHLVGALSIIKNGYGYRPYLVVIGDAEKSSLEGIGLEGRSIGATSDPRVIADYDAASDVYLAPSLAENSPLVVLEALACGIPVVAFRVGGVPEIIKHMETGYIAGYRDERDFAEGIKWLMDMDRGKYLDMSGKCVSEIKERHTLKQQASNFLGVYEHAIKKHRYKKGHPQ
ncbi:MAG: glycosyltransferase [Deltaproteobacteria bacterium]|nr:glycosyltransferase [Deltaproteobacteria bacterium]